MRLVFFMLPLLVGCVSPGDQAIRIGRECEAPLVEAFPDITERLAWRGGNPTVGQMANQNAATPDEIARLISFQPAASECRRRMAAPLSGANPAYGDAWRNLSLAVDRIILALVQRQTTWGEANQRLADTGQRFRGEVSAVRDRDAAREASRPRPQFVPIPMMPVPQVSPVYLAPLPTFQAPTRFQTTCQRVGQFTYCN
ncbi:MAG: hypothetical protein JWO24_785 [Rhodospirillales bacterium]|nr:hypothetical protein [Rhodospirillales bacterium]